MIHSARELGRLAKDFDLVVLLTTLTAQIAFPEEQSPSILATSNAKPSLGSSWKYATDLQIYLTKLDPTNNHRLVEFTRSDAYMRNVHSSSIGIESNKTPAMRVAEILKTKRLQHLLINKTRNQFTLFSTAAAEMSSEQIDKLRDSSTLIIAAPIPKSKVVPGKADYKILFLQRNRSGAAPGAHVFPGGNVDKADHDPRWASLVDYKPNGSKAPPLHNVICAIREAFEESGVLVSEPQIGLSNSEISLWRTRVHDNAQEFYNLCVSHNVKPAVGRLAHFSSWITPPVETKRFHTQFFITVLPWSRDSFAESRVFADGKETTRLDWLSPEEALDAYRTRDIQTLLPPQFVSISDLTPVKQHEKLLEHYREREIVDIMPEFTLESQDENGLHLSGILPGDQDHSSITKPGYTHRIRITKNKKGMSVRSYINGAYELKARL
ncbi:Nucleoside diphosphate-linked moiety X motif 19, mitochondrial [Entomortierella beljakovae]|nr:Nucleoside diphosphate-linked moiety X motif 19, mitochondrial [Entomortierella beljakovae]